MHWPIETLLQYVGRTLAVTSTLLFAGCSPKEAVSTETTATESSTNAVPSHEATSLVMGGPPGYVGSKTCQPCHEDQYASWHRSFHRTMTQLPTPESVQADFRGVVLTNDDTRFSLSRRTNEFWVRMERIAPSPPGAAAPEGVEVRMGLVTGSHHMQVFWVPNGMGNCQVGFPFTWLIPEKRWVPRNSTFLRPPTLELRPETWNFVCARCHATGTQPNLDRASLTWHTRVGEMGIACEACHGPGERHAVQQRELERLSIKPAQSANLAIIHPEKLSPVRAAQICGFCHSMKWWDSKEGWPERGFSFRPGDDLEATTPIIRPNQVEKQPWLRRALASNPDLFDDFFWSDGMVRVSGRDYNGLIESPCYQGGQFSCLSCHSLHKSEPDDQLARNRTDNRACTQCHERFRQQEAVTAHTRHTAESSGSQCYNCHMPHTTYGVLSAIRSHQVSSPKVEVELATGRPNACNLCHLDKPLAWTARQLAEWYGHPIPKLSPDETAVADAVRLALAGDAGQRALMAWHLSWEPALETSGRAWIPPVLAALLDDPYSAVRCVAERSLKKVSDLAPTNYDYTATPASRPLVQGEIHRRWMKGLSVTEKQRLTQSTVVQPDNLEAMEDRFRELSRQQNDRLVRLRE